MRLGVPRQCPSADAVPAQPLTGASLSHPPASALPLAPSKRLQLPGNGGIQPSTTQAADSRAPDCTWGNVQPAQMVLTLCPNCFYPHNSFQRRRGCTGKGEAFALDKMKCRVWELSPLLSGHSTAQEPTGPLQCVQAESGASALWEVGGRSLYPGAAEPPAPGGDTTRWTGAAGPPHPQVALFL